jgi:hypothetical protein
VKGMLVIIHFLTKNKMFVLSIVINVLLAVALSILIYLVYPQLIYEMDSVKNWDRYSVRIYRKDFGSSYFEVLMGSEEYLIQPHVLRRIYSHSGGQRFYIEILGKDITGNGVPNLVVSQYLGGAHGVYRYLVLELDGSAVNEVDVIDGIDAEFRDLNNDGLLEITGIDRAYDYFLGDSFAASPRPSVVLSFDTTKEKYVLDRQLMTKSPFSRDQLNELSTKYREDIRWHKESRPPSVLFDTMLKLVYSGNEKQAWELFDTSWPEGTNTKMPKEEYKEHIEKELRHSPFYPTIAGWNKEKS